MRSSSTLTHLLGVSGAPTSTVGGGIQLATMPTSSDAKKLTVGRHCCGPPVMSTTKDFSRNARSIDWRLRIRLARTHTVSARSTRATPSAVGQVNIETSVKRVLCVCATDPVATYSSKETQHKRPQGARSTSSCDQPPAG